MNRADLEAYLEAMQGAERTYPFGPDPLVFKVMDKMFAYVSNKEGIDIVTIKCIPFDGALLAENYKAITPGYHMSKKHWITIALTDEIPDDMLSDLMDKSYELVVSKLTKANREQLSQCKPSE
ncbi:MAG: MmcQ/YjbR family DNA-binding protein [Cyanobacteria bacterium J06627_28]